jgi:Na+/H+ antiporter NhaC
MDAEPGLVSILPAVVAIALALTTRQVLLSLVGGVFTGAALLHGVVAAPAAAIDLVIATLADKDKLKVVTFTLAMGGLVGVIAASGGTKGIVELVKKRAKTPRSGMLASFAMGLLVFFDDYASTLLVGNTMRPITDSLRISREKLSYIVDSTAAPVASLALISTWIGYEVSVLGDAMKNAGIPGDPYAVFVSGLPSRFYPVFALLFVVFVAVQGRDFGPMRRAEARARKTGAVIREGAQPLVDAALTDEQKSLEDIVPRASIAIVSIVSLVACVLAVLAERGSDASYDALLYGAAAGLVVALAMTVGMRALTIDRTMDAVVRGVRSMALAILVLALAWSVGKVMADLKAGEALARFVGDAVPTWSLPTVTFLLAAGMAFATGTSWGTMAILFPIVVPVLATHQSLETFQGLFLATTSAVLSGAVFGDHCSPISDTTVLSSISCASDHVDHTRTQIPYAMLCGTVAILFGTLPTGLGLSPWPGLVLGVAVLWIALRVLGSPPEDAIDS